MSNLKLINDSCVNQNVDAIVNAANKYLLAGGGICGAIFKKAGLATLTNACSEYARPLKDGEAVITPAFGITNAKYIIHAVGPDFNVTPKAFKELFEAYYNSLVVLKNNHLHTLLAYLEQIGYRKEITVFICDEIHDKVIDVFKTTAGGYSEAYKSIVVEKKRTATPNKYLNEAEELYFNYAKKYAAVLQSLLSGFNGNNEKEKIGYLIRHNATYGLGDIQWVKWLHNL